MGVQETEKSRMEQTQTNNNSNKRESSREQPSKIKFNVSDERASWRDFEEMVGMGT
jgi:hypothetical protein